MVASLNGTSIDGPEAGLEFLEISETNPIPFGELFARSPDSVKGILLLFRNDINLYVNEVDKEDYYEFLEIKDINTPFNKQAIMNALIPKNSCKAIKPGTYELLQEILKGSYPQLAHSIECVGMYDCIGEPFSQLIKYLENVELILELFTPETLLKCLDTTKSLIHPDVKNNWKTETDQFKLMTDILKEIPYYSQWYWRFMDDLSRNSIGAAVVDEINPNFDIEKELHEKQMNEENEAERIREYFEGLDHVPTLEELVRIDKTRSADIEGGSNLGQPCEMLNLYDYQKELAQPALPGPDSPGYNTLVCSVTGSGKTEVAVEVIKDTLVKEEGKEKKIVMLVPTQVLVDQQCLRLQKYLRDKYRVIKFQGNESTRICKGRLLYQADVAVTTPQIFVNILNHNGDVNIGLHQVSLLVFDECHHCDSNHPYKEIMNKYMDIKWANGNDGTKSGRDLGLPKILGLTASLAAGRFDNVNGARGIMEKKAAFLDASVLASVRSATGKANLAEKVRLPTDKLITVHNMWKESNSIIRPLLNFMSECERKIKLEFDLCKNSGFNVSGLQMQPDKKLTSKRSGAQYLQWVLKLKQEVTTGNMDNIRKRIIKNLLEFLRIGCNALYLFAHVSLEGTLSYLDKENSRNLDTQSARYAANLVSDLQETEDAIFVQDHFTETIINIQLNGQALEENECNPLLQVLVDRLKQMKSGREKGGGVDDDRALVFVERRVLAYYLQDFLDTELLELHPDWVASANAKTGDEKFVISKEELADRVKRFSEGNCRLLICTEVLGEGFDIKACNLVVKYNHVTNVRKLIQERGRARALGAECVLIAGDGWLAEKEQNNMMQEQLLNDALELIALGGVAPLEKKNCQTQKGDYQARMTLLKDKEMNDKRLDGFAYDICCAQCEATLTNTKSMRMVGKHHYVLIDNNIWNKMLIDQRKKSISNRSIYAGICVAGLICQGSIKDGVQQYCNALVGKVLKIEECWYPVFSARNVTLKDPEKDERFDVPKKSWKRAAAQEFCVPLITDIEVFRCKQNLIERLDIKRLTENDEENSATPVSTDGFTLTSEFDKQEEAVRRDAYVKEGEQQEARLKDWEHVCRWMDNEAEPYSSDTEGSWDATSYKTGYDEMEE